MTEFVQMTHKLQYGVAAGRRWISGTAPLKKGTLVKLDTRTGEGLDAVLKEMKSQISWQASGMKLPGYDAEDLTQELSAIVLSAVPDYTPEKAANLCTFLQNHLEKRIKNLYKFATEQCRTALARPDRPSKASCTECGQAHFVDANSAQNIVCKCCGAVEGEGGKKRWKRFPLQIQSFSANQSLWFSNYSGDEEQVTFQDFCTYEDLKWLWRSDGEEDVAEKKLAIMEIVDDQDEKGVLIVKHLLDGMSVAEICKATGFGKAVVRARLAKAKERV